LSGATDGSVSNYHVFIGTAVISINIVLLVQIYGLLGAISTNGNRFIQKFGTNGSANGRCVATYSVNRKKHTKMFFISSQNLADSDKILCVFFTVM